MSHVNLGFVPSTYNEEDYILGGISKLPQTILVPDRDWGAYLPSFESQKNNIFDTFSCTNFANCNILEILHKRLYGEDVNMSDMFSAAVTGTKSGHGNSHKNVAELTRKRGFVTETIYPFLENTPEKYFFQKPPHDVRSEGLKWVEKNEYGYERVLVQNIYDALQFSPVQVGVDSRTVRTERFVTPNHSVVIYGVTNTSYKVFDTYLNRDVEYDRDYPFVDGIRFHYAKSTIVQPIDNMKNWSVILRNFIQSLVPKLGFNT